MRSRERDGTITKMSQIIHLCHVIHAQIIQSRDGIERLLCTIHAQTCAIVHTTHKHVNC